VIHAPNDPFGYVDTMSSEHPEGCNVLMGDGSVHYINDMINHAVWSAMCSRNGEEVLEGIP
jgi:prepilin-type processing-associated H-X9-DG protein